jgi:hypothetical protein
LYKELPFQVDQKMGRSLPMMNLLKMATSGIIRAVHHRGWSHRYIAAELAINHETIARRIRRTAPPSKPANASIRSEVGLGESKPANTPIGSEGQCTEPKPANMPPRLGRRSE